MLKRRISRFFSCLSPDEETAAEQQPLVSFDLVKRAVIEALNEQSSSTTCTPENSSIVLRNRKKLTIIPNTEVKLRVDEKQTRIDPEFRAQRDAIIGNKDLSDAVNQWSTVNTMEELVEKIKTCAKTELEKAWLLFCWIGKNIRYDLQCKNNSAESVFRERVGVCRGFVSLYHECCSLLSIECLEISGYAKQSFLKSGENLQNSPHAWNAIILDEYTYLLDPTWGAGGGDGSNELEDFYFLTSPEAFIYTHFCIGHQLLEPEINKEDFLSLPVMKSTYYRLKLNLLSPKQGFNQTSENLFQIAIRTPDDVDIFPELKIGDMEYPRKLHTLCQRDMTMPDVINCFIAPPADGLYEVVIYARTNNETTYHDAIYMRLNVVNIIGSITFSFTYQPFKEHRCILIEPFNRLIQENERVRIHMKIPDANVVKIQHAGDYIVPTKDEYKNGILMKEIIVQSDISICARWDDNADSISIVCVFNMI